MQKRLPGSVAIFGVMGFLTHFFAKKLTVQGDLVPHLPGGQRGDGLPYHLTALVFELVALAFFLAGLYRLYRYFKPKDVEIERDQRQPSPSDYRSVDRDTHANIMGGDFDPDAALKRYMERRARDGETAELPTAARSDRNEPKTPPPPPAPRGFGRKGL